MLVVLLPAINCELDKAAWGLLIISVFMALALGTTVDKVVITRLALGDARMSEDGGISTLEADGSTVAIVPDWARDEFFSLTLKLVCEGTVVTVANVLSSTGGEEMLLVVVLLAATDRRFPLVAGDGI